MQSRSGHKRFGSATRLSTRKKANCNKHIRKYVMVKRLSKVSS